MAFLESAGDPALRDFLKTTYNENIFLILNVYCLISPHSKPVKGQRNLMQILRCPVCVRRIPNIERGCSLSHVAMLIVQCITVPTAEPLIMCLIASLFATRVLGDRKIA